MEIGDKGTVLLSPCPFAQPFRLFQITWAQGTVPCAIYQHTGPSPVLIVGIAGSMGCAVNGLNKLCQVVKIVIGIAYSVAVTAAGLCILHQAVCEVVVVGGSPSGGRIGDRCQGTVYVTLHFVLRRCSKIP